MLQEKRKHKSSLISPVGKVDGLDNGDGEGTEDGADVGTASKGG